MIKQLSKQVAQDLCAQQVITSICDSIKQLVDNSIDAGSTWVQVQLQQYGKQRIKVRDNGSGIQNFQFLAQKGSTSKNKGKSEQINTLGFRGQALHSLAKVSQKMSIISTHLYPTPQTNHFDLKKLTLTLTPIYPVRQQSGTTVQIQSIFQYLPVRRYQLQNKYKQFLKKTDQIIKQYCLIFPKIKFILKNTRQGKQDIIIQTAHNNNSDQKTIWLNRIREILGYKLAQNLLYINTQSLKGWILKNIQSGSSKQNTFIRKNLHYLYLNNRPIDPLPKITYVFDQYYKKYNRSTKYVYILNIILPWQTYDVNLTPNKRQILIKQILINKIVVELRQFIEKNVVENVPVLDAYRQRQEQIKVKNNGSTIKKNKLKQVIVSSQDNCCNNSSIYQATGDKNKQRQQIMNRQYKTQNNIHNHNNNHEHRTHNNYNKSNQNNRQTQPQKPNNNQKPAQNPLKLSKQALQQQIQQKIKNRYSNITTNNNKNSINNKLLESLNKKMTSNKGIDHVISYSTLGIKKDNNVPILRKQQEISIKQVQFNERIKRQNIGYNQIIYEQGQQKRQNKQIQSNLQQSKPKITKQYHKQQQTSQKSKDRILLNPAQQPQQPISHNLQKQSFLNFEIIGQFNHGFIVCMYQNKFYLIDQHAASEKYYFQKFLNSVRNKAQVCQKIQLNAIQRYSIQQNKNKLLQDGYKFQILQDQNSILLTEVPIFMGKNYGKQYFLELASSGKSLTQIPEYYTSAATKACRTAVMVGDVLQPKQMKKIVNQLSNLKSPWNCPHGRPTLIYLGEQKQIQKQIKVGQRKYTIQ